MLGQDLICIVKIRQGWAEVSDWIGGKTRKSQLQVQFYSLESLPSKSWWRFWINEKSFMKCFVLNHLCTEIHVENPFLLAEQGSWSWTTYHFSLVYEPDGCSSCTASFLIHLGTFRHCLLQLLVERHIGSLPRVFRTLYSLNSKYVILDYGQY